MNKKFIAAAVIAAVLAVGAILWSVERSRPEEVVSRMIEKMSRVKSAHFKATVEAGGRAVALAPSLPGLLPAGEVGSPSGDSSVAADLEGDLDLSDPVFPLLQMFFNYVRSVGGESPARFDGEIRVRDQKTYLIKNPVSDNRWVSLGAASPNPETAAPAEDDALLRENVALIRERFAQGNFFTVSGVKKPSKIDGVAVFDYEVKVNRQELRAFLVDAAAVYKKRDPSPDEIGEIDRQLAALGEIDGELWIGQRDRLLYRVRLGAEAADGSWRADVVLNQHDQPVAVEAPADALPLGDIFRLLPAGLPASSGLGASATGAGEPAAGALTNPAGGGADSDGDGLSDELETFYGTDQTNPDSDGDGMNDGDEVDAGRNPRGAGGLFDFGIGN